MREQNSLQIGKFALLAAMILMALVIVLPLLIMVLGSFKDPLEVTNFNLTLPKKWLLTNYLDVIAKGKIIRAFLNSILITSIAVVITICLSSMASFILARKKGRFSTALYFFFFIGMLAPMQTIPTIRIFQFLHIYGGYAGAILIFSTLNISFSCLLYTGFIKGIPQALDEVAVLEGASLLRVFFAVIFPLLTPINMTVLILIFMTIWNDIYIPLFFLTAPTKWTMPLSVYNFFGQFSGSYWNLVFADLTLTALPVVLLYVFVQKYIVAGLTSGAVKQ